MGKISEEEKKKLASIIEEKGFYPVKSTEAFEKYLDNSIEGFKNNSLFSYICGGEFDVNTVKALMCTSYSVVVNTAIAYADSPELNSCAVWIPSGVFRDNFKDFFAAGGVSMFKNSGKLFTKRLLDYEKSVNNMKRNHTNHNDYYLFNYECSPKVDSTELFSQMVKPVVDYAWNTGRTCYVELSIEARINALLKMGFHIADKVRFPKEDITVYGMMV